MAHLEGLAAHNERGQRDPHRATLNVCRLFDRSNTQLDNTELLDAQQWGEALARSIEAWRHRGGGVPRG